MIRIIVFNVIYAICALFALARGGAPERIGAAILIADFEVSLFVVQPMASRFSGVEWSMLAVDTAAFAAFYILSLFTTRFWPAWLAGLQGSVALSHLAGLRSAIVPWAYGTVVAIWSYVMLVLLAVATWRHLYRKRRYGMDPAWVWRLPAAYRAGASGDDCSRANVPRTFPGDLEKGVGRS